VIIDQIKIIEHAARLAGVPSSRISSEMLQVAKENLYLILVELGNECTNLWALEDKTIGLRTGQAAYYIPEAFDVFNVTHRTITKLGTDEGAPYTAAGGVAAYAFDSDVGTACTNTSANGSIALNCPSEQTVTLVGFLPANTATRSLVWEYATEWGGSWTPMLTATPDTEYTDNEWTYWNLDPNITASYFRLREARTATVLTAREVVFATQTTDILCTALNRDDYYSLPNKDFSSSQVRQYYVNRRVDGPELIFWPVPDSDFNAFHALVHAYVTAPGALNEKLSIPDRWLMSLIHQLALRILLETPGISQSRLETIASLVSTYNQRARDEERNKSPVRMAPRLRCYTRM
jgi:hypothetical protein